MTTSEVETQSRTGVLVERIEELRQADALRAEQQYLPKEVWPERALPYGIVLSAAALRGEGVAVPQTTERRVVAALGVSYQSWTRAIVETQAALGPEATTESKSGFMSVTLEDEARQAIMSKPFVGFLALRAMVKLAVEQEQGLKAQAQIARDNISVEAQQ